MKKFVVITSINPPSEAVEAFSRWNDWEVVVVGDKKTPLGWHCENVKFLDVQRQDLFEDFSASLPFNTYIRKMLGYAYAIKNGAEAIFESDDDNIPYDDAESIATWFLEDENSHPPLRSESGWINVYDLFGEPYCWPRGFPLSKISDKSNRPLSGICNSSPSVIQFLADGDSDFDAIHRLINGEVILFFDKRKAFVFDKGTCCPVNSQSTLWKREAFPLLFFPTGILDRVVDILRGYILTYCLWEVGSCVGFASPIVFQKRNRHDLMKDFRQEIELYDNNWFELLSNIKGSTLEQCYRSALGRLCQEQVVPKSNLVLYEKFLEACGL